jgi:hypothetical protein
MTFKHLACTVVIGLLPFAAEANLATFSNQTTFLSATGATLATEALPDLPGVYNTVHLGSVTFTDVSGWKFWVGGLSSSTPNNWTTLLEGNEIAINSAENLDVTFDAPVYSAGFDFAEPGALSVSSPYANDASYPYADSIFTVTLKNNSTTVGTFTFNAPDEVASFVGVWSDTAFNRMEIRETTGAIEDDYFGQFYTGNAAPVPEPETYALMLAGLGMVGFAARRRNIN